MFVKLIKPLSVLHCKSNLPFSAQIRIPTFGKKFNPESKLSSSESTHHIHQCEVYIVLYLLNCAPCTFEGMNTHVSLV